MLRLQRFATVQQNNCCKPTVASSEGRSKTGWKPGRAASHEHRQENDRVEWILLVRFRFDL